jgi:hypothetical protein
VKLTIGHAAQPHPAAQALAIGGRVALFLAGHAAGWPRCSPSSAAGAFPLSARRKSGARPPQTHRSDQSHRADPAGCHSRALAHAGPRE